jgi:hypothetical protein
VKVAHDLKPDTRCCVADGITTQRDVLPYKRVYLCEFHRSLWDAADARESEKEARRGEVRV